MTKVSLPLYRFHYLMPGNLSVFTLKSNTSFFFVFFSLFIFCSFCSFPAIIDFVIYSFTLWTTFAKDLWVVRSGPVLEVACMDRRLQTASESRYRKQTKHIFPHGLNVASSGQFSLSIAFSLQCCERAGISKLTPMNREDINLFRPLVFVMFYSTFLSFFLLLFPPFLPFPPFFVFSTFYFFFLLFPPFFFPFFFFIPLFLTNCNLSATLIMTSDIRTTICNLQFLSSTFLLTIFIFIFIFFFRYLSFLVLFFPLC